MSHRDISFIKSGLRMVGYSLLLLSLVSGVVVLMLSEVVGILEEVGPNGN